MTRDIVLLEDEPDLAALVAELLEEVDYTVVHVTNVDDLLRECALRSPCVALVDGMSPTGFDLWWLGAELLGLGVPPVAFTAHASAIHEFEADSHGFAGMVAKPFDADEFVRLVTSICWNDHQVAVS